MSDTSRSGVPIPPPKPNKGADPSPVLLIVQIVLGAFLVFTLLIVPLVGAFTGTAADDSATDTTVQISAFGLFLTTVVFQFVQGSYPAISSLRRGSTMKRDWKFLTTLPKDIGIGFGLAVLCLIGAQVATLTAASLVGLDNTDDASNTDILTDYQGSIWLVGIIALVVIGAPLAEELLFRGYVLRTLEKPLGSVLAIIISSLLFAVPHWQPGATWQETSVLLPALAVVGLVLAIGAVKTGRLGPSIIAHFFFNAVGTVATLA